MLTDTRIRSLGKKGLYGDGSRLYLQVSSNSAKSWIFRWKIEGKTRYFGLGPYPAITLKAAREAAGNCNRLLAAGIDPIEEKNKGKAEKEASKNTSEVVARECAESKSQAFRNEIHKWQWFRTLEMYAFPYIGHMKISEIRHPDIVRLLEPIWLTKAETAKRTRQRIESVLTMPQDMASLTELILQTSLCLKTSYRVALSISPNPNLTLLWRSIKYPRFTLLWPNRNQCLH